MSTTFREIDITKDNVLGTSTSWRVDGGYVLRLHEDNLVSYNDYAGLT